MAQPEGMMDSNNRTHEPSLRELTAQLDDLRELVEHQRLANRDLMLERDRRYEDRFKAQETATSVALSAQKELTAASFASAEKAIIKAETAQSDYNVRSNEFRGQLDDQAKTLMPRTEAMTSFASMRERSDRDRDEARQLIDGLKAEIYNLRESRSEGTGRHQQVSDQRLYSNWIVGVVIIPCVLSLLALVVAFVHR